jgi:alanyl-tRNA synthetase
MKKLTASYLRDLYLNFFKEKNHAIIPSSSLIPENDPTVLFTTAGMQPLVPYLMGETHPSGKRIANVQKCLRTGDIESVGDSTHFTFFEMLGNWSFGDYFKKESIAYSFEFLTGKKYLNLEKERLYFTVFAGDKNAERDNESADIWKSLGVDESHIFYLDKTHNWWGPAGETGPCGPDTEIFYDTKPNSDLECHPEAENGRLVEIWNNVFMQYYKNSDGTYSALKQKNVDTGMGLERVLMSLQNLQSGYDIGIFDETIQMLESLSGISYNSDKQKSFRIICDHVRTATFILGDERAVTPSNTDQGYVLRRLIRRSIRHIKNLGINQNILKELSQTIVNNYKDVYTELEQNKNFIFAELEKEEILFGKTLVQGMREFEKLVNRLSGNKIVGTDAFRLFDTFGFPIEFTQELAEENNLDVDIQGYQQAYKTHQEKSRKGAEQKFKGGLVDHSEKTTRLHTATHILQAVLREKFGETVMQRGSNITPERLRFDFSFDRKVTPEEINEIEARVNEIVQKQMPIHYEEMSYEKAQEVGALGLFKDKYDLEKVKVYFIGDYSIECCGGPHVKNTSEIGKFTIKKEEASSSGVRRIKAIIE